jgi:hypothetical protein
MYDDATASAASQPVDPGHAPSAPIVTPAYSEDTGAATTNNNVATSSSDNTQEPPETSSTAASISTTQDATTDSHSSGEGSSTTNSPATTNDDLALIKQEALKELNPLVSHLNQTPEEKFRTTMMMIQAADDDSLIKDAYEAAKAIKDEKARAQALLDVVNEINYFTQQPSVDAN